jgi:hypothetical protein
VVAIKPFKLLTECVAGSTAKFPSSIRTKSIRSYCSFSCNLTNPSHENIEENAPLCSKCVVTKLLFFNNLTPPTYSHSIIARPFAIVRFRSIS